MTTILQAGKGYQSVFVLTSIRYYTRIFQVRTNLFISNDYNGDKFLGVIDRYHKIGQIFFLYEGYVVKQAFLEYLKQDWGNYIAQMETDLPIFIELDGLSLGESEPIGKHIHPGTQYAASQSFGKLNVFQMLQDILFGLNISDILPYVLDRTVRYFAKYKPGLYSQMIPVDQIAIESFRDDCIIELELKEIR